MEVKQLEVRNNVFVDHLKILLADRFSNMPVRFTISYMVGETEGVKGLYFEIQSTQAGIIYDKFEELKAYELPSDKEEEFISEVVNDLILGGLTFLYVEKGKLMHTEHHQKKLVTTHTLFLN